MAEVSVEIPWERYGTIAYIAEHVTMFGKTALQKLIYFMQEWKHVPLEYGFQLYTYGPFSAEVMGDLDYAQSLGAVRVEYILNGGYSIKPGEQNQALQARAHDFLEKYKSEMDDVINAFGKCSAVHLELLATTHYAYKEHELVGPGCKDFQVVEAVKAMKPGKFSDADIQRALGRLREHGVIAV